ncbi:hypothetical protein VULLAG_LOCUS11752 [Vulpes lagopus]
MSHGPRQRAWRWRPLPSAPPDGAFPEARWALPAGRRPGAQGRGAGDTRGGHGHARPCEGRALGPVASIRASPAQSVKWQLGGGGASVARGRGGH